MRQKDSAICLRAVDYSETSQVAHFFTRSSGVVHLLGKGSKRSKSMSGGAVDMLSEGELVFITSTKGTLGTLVEFAETATHGGIRKDAARLNCGLYMLEMITVMLPEGDPYPELFDLLSKTLRRLGQANAPISAVLGYFQLRLLRSVGLLGQLSECVVCNKAIAAPGARGGAFFSSRLGGLICREHETAAEEKLRIDVATLAGIAAMAAAEAGRKVDLPEAQARGINRLLAYHAQQQLGKVLKMARYVIT